MFGSVMIDVAIGLVLFFFMVSLMCSSIREIGESYLKSRARDLERGLRTLLDDPTGTLTMPKLMEHGLIGSLFQGKYDPKNLKGMVFGDDSGLAIGARAEFPSYIPAGQFVVALLDVVMQQGQQPAGPITATGVREAADHLPSGKLRQAILGALDVAQDDLTATRAELEKWFDGTMDRVSGWYKRRTQWVLFGIGCTVAIVLNLDTLTVARALYNEPALRAAVVDMAGTVTLPAADETAQVEKVRESLMEARYPMGWRVEADHFPWPAPQVCKSSISNPTLCVMQNIGIKGWLSIFVGWLITGLAVTLGAPFWFDMLSKVMTVRSTLKPKDA